MNREIKTYTKTGEKVPSVVILDVRDLLYGSYSVEKLVLGGYESVYTSASYEKCVEKAETLFAEVNG